MKSYGELIDALVESNFLNKDLTVSEKTSLKVKTTFEKLEVGDLFANEHGQIMVRGYGVWFHTGKIVYCDEGDVGRYYVEADAPVTRINLPDETIGV